MCGTANVPQTRPEHSQRSGYKRMTFVPSPNRTSSSRSGDIPKYEVTNIEGTLPQELVGEFHPRQTAARVTPLWPSDTDTRLRLLPSGTHYICGAGRVRVGPHRYGHWFDGALSTCL